MEAHWIAAAAMVFTSLLLLVLAWMIGVVGMASVSLAGLARYRRAPGTKRR